MAKKEEEKDTKKEKSNLEPEETSEDPTLTLKQYNEQAGKSYKSWDSIVKSEKERDKTISTQGQLKKGIKTEEDKSLLEDIYLEQHPEAKQVWDKVVTEAGKLKQNPIKLYKESSYFQSEAKVLNEKENQKTEDGKKVTKPSNKIDSSKSFENVNKWSDLSSKDQADYFNKKAQQEKDEMMGA